MRRHRILIRCISTFHLAEKHVSSSRTSKPPQLRVDLLLTVSAVLRPRLRDDVACAAEEVEFEPGRGFRVGDQGQAPFCFFGPCAWRSALRPPCPHPSLFFSNFSSSLFILIVPTPGRERMSSPSHLLRPPLPTPLSLEAWRKKIGGREEEEES